MTLTSPYKNDAEAIFAVLLATLTIVLYKNWDYLNSFWDDIFKGKWGNSKRAEMFYKVYALYIMLSIIRLTIWYYEYFIK